MLKILILNPVRARFGLDIFLILFESTCIPNEVNCYLLLAGHVTQNCEGQGHLSLITHRYSVRVPQNCIVLSRLLYFFCIFF